ncbi:MAG: MFS transporter [Planctomycetota bacterium]
MSFQFFVYFAVLGCIVPYFTVYLVEWRGLTEAQTGLLYGFHGLAVLVSPVVLTLFADTKLANRMLIGGCFGVSVVGMAALLFGQGVVWVVVGYAVFRMAYSPIMSLEDGLAFADQHDRAERGVAVTPYHATRVWGTYGFLAGSLSIYVALAWGVSLAVVTAAAAAWCGLGLIHAWRLPAVAEMRDEANEAVPTLDAARRLMTPRLLGFCVAMLLLMLAAGGYYAFYPLWLVRDAGVSEKWIGLIVATGVALEIVPILALRWLVRRLGVRLLLLGTTAIMALRLAWLASDASVFTAVASQLLHGPMVLAVHVVAPVYLNHHAEPSYRSSMQGVYSMAVLGVGALIGPAIAGWIAEGWGLPAVFAYATALTVVAAVLMGVSVDRQGDREIGE